MIVLFPWHTPLFQLPVQMFWPHTDTTFLDRLWHQVLKSDRKRSGSCSQTWLQPFNLGLRSNVFEVGSPQETEDFAQMSYKVKKMKGQWWNPKYKYCLCEPTEGTSSKTDKLALFFLSFWSPVFHISMFQRESKTYCWEQFLQRDAVSKLVLGVPFCTPLWILFLHAMSYRVPFWWAWHVSHYFRYHELEKKHFE